MARPSRRENVISFGPDLLGKAYEINPRLIDMLKGNIIQGDAIECPYMHINKINIACGTFQLQDLTNEEIMEKIFPYSLDGGAARWLER